MTDTFTHLFSSYLIVHLMKRALISLVLHKIGSETFDQIKVHIERERRSWVKVQ